ncbi:MAG: efflux RND transporter periplasmic adaptor subunit [Pirellulaceae bacterium]
MKVSLLGQPSSEAVVAALSKHPVGQSGRSSSTPTGHADANSPVMVPRAEVTQILKLIEAAAAADDRSGALSAIVDLLATYFADANIRCGLGARTMRRLYDRKLGWLGAESSLFDEAQQRWDRRSATRTGKSASSDVQVFTVAIPQPDADGFCAIWISGHKATPHWLMAAAPALRAIVWERPVKSWLRAPERIRRVSSVWLASGLVVFLAIALWPIHYRIACTAVVQPAAQRLVATPFEATLLESKVKPGDTVKAGDLLVLLDGRPLRIELESVGAEIQHAEKEHDIALANGRIAEAQQSALSKRTLLRRRQLLSDRLRRLEVVSPIDGVIVSGDLDRYVGSPLEIGQTIVEVAPLGRVTVEVEIPEFEIGYVQSDAQTRVRFASVGGKSIRQPIENVYPSAEIRDDSSVFVAKFDIDNADGKLRPGMRGDATTYGPLRPMSWSWVRGAWERMLWWAGY